MDLASTMVFVQDQMQSLKTDVHSAIHQQPRPIHKAAPPRTHEDNRICHFVWATQTAKWYAMLLIIPDCGVLKMLLVERSKDDACGSGNLAKGTHLALWS